jgi:hypothetical protein
MEQMQLFQLLVTQCSVDPNVAQIFCGAIYRSSYISPKIGVACIDNTVVAVVESFGVMDPKPLSESLFPILLQGFSFAPRGFNKYIFFIPPHLRFHQPLSPTIPSQIPTSETRNPVTISTKIGGMDIRVIF